VGPAIDVADDASISGRLPPDSVDWDDLTNSMTLDENTGIDMDTMGVDLSIDGTTLVIDSSESRVGIGTEAPDAKLGVLGNVSVSGSLSIENNLSVDNNVVAGYFHGDGAGLTNLNIGGSLAPDVLDWADLTNTMTLDENTGIDMDTMGVDLSMDGTTFVIDSSESRVGVGTATPDAKLDVEGNLSVNGNVETTGDVIIGGDNIDSDGSPLALNADFASTQPVFIGTTSHTGIADEGGDLYVEEDVEIRGNLSIGGDTTIAGVVFGDDHTQISDNLTAGEDIDLRGQLFDGVGPAIDIADDTSISGRLTVYGNDADDYFTVETLADVPTIQTYGASSLEIAPSDDLVLDPTGANVNPGSDNTDSLGQDDNIWANVYTGAVQGGNGDVLTIASSAAGANAIDMNATAGGITLDTDGASDINMDGNTLYVDTSGDLVGVGSATPQAKLDIQGNLSVAGNLSTDGAVIIGGDTIDSDGAALALNADFASTQPVFIGTTSHTGIADEGGDLYVEEDVEIGGNLSIAGDTTISGVVFADGYAEITGELSVAGDLDVRGKIFDGVGPAIDVADDASISGRLTVYGNDVDDYVTVETLADVPTIQTYGSSSLEIAPSDDLVLDPTGNNVNPGSDNADSLGQDETIWANVYAGAVQGGNGDVLTIASSAAGANAIDMNATAGGITLDTDGTSDINMDANTLYVDTSADLVGVGSATPQAKLDIQGNLSVAGNLSTDGSVIIGGDTIDSDGSPLALNADFASTQPVFIGTTSHTGIADEGGDLYVEEDVEIGGNLSVAGDTTISGVIFGETYTEITNDLTVTGAIGAQAFTRSPIYYDSTDKTYYLDPSNAGTSLNIAGGVSMADSETIGWASGQTITSDGSEMQINDTLDIANGETYKINNTDVLSGTSLGSGVDNSSLQNTNENAFEIGDGSGNVDKTLTFGDDAETLHWDDADTQFELSDDISIAGDLTVTGGNIDSSGATLLLQGITNEAVQIGTTKQDEGEAIISRAGDLKVFDDLDVHDDLSVGGNVSIAGNLSLTGWFDFDGITFIDGGLNMDGDLDLNDNDVEDVHLIRATDVVGTKPYLDFSTGVADELGIAANVSLEGNMSISGNVSIDGNLTVDGHVRADYFHGDGSNLTNLDIGGSLPADSLDWTELTDSMTLDANTAIDMDTNSVDLSIDGTTLVIDSSESRVGIGTATPDAKLDVEGNVSVTGNLSVDNNIVATYYYGDGSNLTNLNIGGSLAPDVLDWADLTNTMTLDENTGIDMDTNGVDLSMDGNTFVIDSSESRVGIGTESPDAKLDVAGDLDVLSNIFDNAGLEVDIADNTSISGSLTVYGNDTDDYVAIETLANVPTIQTYGSSDLEIAPSDDLVLDPTGANVNPGSDNTDSLGQDDTIWANVYAGALQGGNGDVLTIASSAAGANAIDMNATAGGITLDTDGASDINMDGNTLYVDTSADLVGVGSATPQAKLDVEGNLSVSGNVTTDGDMIIGGNNLDSDGAALALNADFASTQPVFIGTTTHTGIADEGGDLYVEEDVEIRGDLSIGGDTTIAGVVFAESYAEVTGELSVTGDLDVRGKIFDGLGPAVDISEDASISGRLTVYGNDVDDYFTVETLADVPTIQTYGASSLEIAPSDDLVLDPTGANVNPGSDNTDSLGQDDTIWANVYAGAVQGGNGDVLTIASSAAGANAIDMNATAGGITLDTDGASDINMDGNTLYVDTSEDAVGVGTATPQAKLDIQGDLSVAGDVSTDGIIIVGGDTIDSDGSPLALNADFASTQPVFIGTTSHTGIADEGGDLYVEEDVEIRGNLSIGGDTTIAGVVFGDDHTQISDNLTASEDLDLRGQMFDGVGPAIDVADDASISGRLTVYGNDADDYFTVETLADVPTIQTYGSSDLEIAPSDDLVLDPTGANVNPGSDNTDSLGQDDNIWANVYTGAVQGGNGDVLTIASSSAGANAIDMNATAGGITLDTDGASDINMDGNTLYVDTSADLVGVGSATPQAKLDIGGNLSVAGDVSTDGVIIVGGDTIDSDGAALALNADFASTQPVFIG
ncbi:hypothetical protein ACFL3D_05950, partial [Candidatus Omnitrophota bacterium]